jgi:hypothetical protein
MTGEIGKITIDQIKDLPFIDKYTGVVQVLKYADTSSGSKVIKSFPADCQTTLEDCESGRYKDFTPNDDKRSVTYLEDTGLRIVSREGPYLHMEANFDLVSWLNLPKLGFTGCAYSGLAILGILKKLPTRPFNSGNYHHINIQFVTQKPKSQNPFAKYSYDETVMQFLMYPFDYFVLALRVTFTVDLRCITIAALTPPVDCVNK